MCDGRPTLLMKFKCETYNPYDKRINVSGPLNFAVDNDDVNTYAVEILLPHMIKILNDNWRDVSANQCQNKDCENYWNVYLYPFSGLGCGTCPKCGQETQLVKVET